MLISFLRGEVPTPEELAEDAHCCVMRVGKDGTVMHIMRRVAPEPEEKKQADHDSENR